MECTHAMWWKIPKLVKMILILKYENIKIYEYKKRIYKFLNTRCLLDFSLGQRESCMIYVNINS